MDRAACFERPAGWLSAGHLAKVVSLADPDNLNRVQNDDGQSLRLLRTLRPDP